MIIRGPRPESNFYILDKRISQDRRLSWGARGLLIYLLGKPDNWRVSITDLVNQTAESSKASGRDAVYSLLKELQQVGYIRFDQIRNDDGTMGASAYIVCEIADQLPQHDGVPLTEKPLAANTTLTSTEGLPSTEVTNTDVKLAFDEWRSLFGHENAKLDGKRQRTIARALKSHGAEVVSQCLKGYTKSKWHLGENDRKTRYDDISLFLRDATNIERGVALFQQPDPAKEEHWI